MKKEKITDLLDIYRNYLFALQERKDYGEKYGDTKELMEHYEEVLKRKRVLRNDKPFKKN